MGRTGARVLVDCLVRAHVPLMTCVPGESFLAILDALYDVTGGEPASSSSAGSAGSTGLPDPPRLITARHEAAAANMAEAAGKLAGRPAACFVTRGPGATHASIAVHTAYQDGTPMLLVVGQAQRSSLGRPAFQEIDYEQFFGGIAKLVVQIEDADRTAELVTRALHVAAAGRPGPVVVAVPEDVLTDETDTPAVAPLRPTTARPSRQAVHAAVTALATAERPVLLAGGTGWSQSVSEHVDAFARNAVIPVVTGFRWQDAIDNESDAYVGYLGLGCSRTLRERLESADLVLALGARFDDPTTDGHQSLLGPTRPETLIQVHPDSAELALPGPPGLAIQADVTEFVRDVTAHDDGATPSPERQNWLRTLRSEHLAFREPVATWHPLDLGRVVLHVDETVPDDAIVTNGAGNYTIWVQRYRRFREYGTQLGPRNGAMGYGLPAALAAKALRPDRTVVCFAGDGCMLMDGNELATAVQHELDVTVIVVNNGKYGTIRMHQEREYPGRVIATDLRNPDFVRYAEAFGALGLRATTTREFVSAFGRALTHKGVAVVELLTDPAQLTPDTRLD